MEPIDYFNHLSTCEHLFLEAIDEPSANSLRVEVIEGKASRIAVPVEGAGQSLGEGFPVNVDESCARYKLNWNSYVLYQVTNELFGRAEESQGGILGKLACIYQSSSLLEYILRSTNASDE